MRVYVAAKFERSGEVRDLHVLLRARSHEPTSKWAEGAEAGLSHAEAALMDVEDVRRSDALVLLSQSSRPVGSPAGTSTGRHFETGLAYALGIDVIVVGERESVFHHLEKGLYVVATVDDALALVDRLAGR